MTPAETRHVYSIDQISNLGSGQTIAIVDAYNDPNIASDADVFDKQFMTTLSGTTSYYTAYGASSTWLTVDYASGKKPTGSTSCGTIGDLARCRVVTRSHREAHIMLVEASSSSYMPCSPPIPMPSTTALR